MKMTKDRHDPDLSSGSCDRCGNTLIRYRGDSEIRCYNCNAIYNACGQRLRDDLHSRPNRSAYDDDVDDLTGDEESYLRQEERLDYLEQDHS